MKLPTKAALTAAAGDIVFAGGILASFSYDLGPVSEIFPPWLRSTIAICGVVGGAAIKIGQRFIERAQGIADADNIAVNSAALESIAGVIPAKMPSQSPAAPASRVGGPVVGLLAVFLVAFGLSGCALTPSPATKAKAAAVGKASLKAVADLAEGAAVNAIQSSATRAFNGEQVNTASLESSAAQGLFTQVFSVQNASDVRDIFNAFSGNTMPQTGNKMAVAFSQANPQTPAEKIAVVNAIASAVSQASSNIK